MEKDYYFNKIYPLQNSIFQLLKRLKTNFYLTGGTAASRGYLHHRFSEDLDFFVNDDENFEIWSNRFINALNRINKYRLEILLKEERFVRFIIRQREIKLRIELVNDVPSHIGEIISHKILGRLDSAENILANKITALIDRREPKDLADIWGFCTKMKLSLVKAMEDANSKAAGIFPLEIARILCSANSDDWKTIKWIEAPDCNQYINELHDLGESLIINI